MRKFRRILLTVSAAVFAFAATVTSSVVPVQTQVVAEASTMKLNRTSITLNKGKTYRLKVSGKGKKGVKWSSSNQKVAKVDKSGKVTAVKAGKATITAKVGKKTLKCRVTVKSPKKTNQYYQKLWDYIEENGTTNDYGDKSITYEYNFDDDYDEDVYDASASLEISNQKYDNTINFTVFYSYFDENSELSSVYSSMDLGSDKRLSIIYESLTAANVDVFDASVHNYDPSEYIKDVTEIDFEIDNKSDGVFSDSKINDSANEFLSSSLYVYDAALHSYVGFGLRELGFTNY